RPGEQPLGALKGSRRRAPLEQLLPRLAQAGELGVAFEHAAAQPFVVREHASSSSKAGASRSGEPAGWSHLIGGPAMISTVLPPLSSSFTAVPSGTRVSPE